VLHYLMIYRSLAVRAGLVVPLALHLQCLVIVSRVLDPLSLYYL
jgi:hypothetical protein